MNQVKDFLDYLLNAIKIWIIIQPWEAGLRIRSGKHIKKLKGGIYFRIPYLDSVYVQQARLRVVSIPVQTLTSKDGKTITLSATMGYQITDIEQLYLKLYHPEMTLANMGMSEVADFIYQNDVKDLHPHEIEKSVLAKFNTDEYGVKVSEFRLTNFAIVRTYRLIEDRMWVEEGIRLDAKR